LASWGNSLAQLGRYPDAFEKYAEAVRVAPRTPWILVDWGNHLVASGRRLAGFRKFAQAIELSPGEHWAIGEWSGHLARMERVERARLTLEAYTSRTDVPPRASGIARALWARHLWQLGQPELAEEEFARATELAANEAWVLRDWADLAWESGDRPKAIELLAKASALAPEESSYAALLSDRLWDDQQHDRAIEQSARAANLSPDEQNYLSTLIDRLYDQSRDTEALAEFERRSIPVRTPAWMVQRSGAAFADVRPAGGIDQAWLHTGWGNYLWSMGRQSEALAKYALASAWSPSDSGYRTHWADRLLESGDPQAALSKYATVLESDPGNPDARVKSGVALAALGRHDEAILRFIELSKLDPGMPGLLEAWSHTIGLAVGPAPDCEKLAALMEDFEPIAASAETPDGLAGLETKHDRCVEPAAPVK
jgi:tetratricopeptide (TPR) repeat protein